MLNVPQNSVLQSPLFTGSLERFSKKQEVEGNSLPIHCPVEEDALFVARGYIDPRIKVGRTYKVFFAGETIEKDRLLFEAELSSIRHASVPGRIFNLSFKGQGSFYSDNSPLGYIFHELDKDRFALSDNSLSIRPKS